MIQKKEGPMTNMDVLQMDQDSFITYIYGMIPRIQVDYEDPESILKAGAALGDCANVYTFFGSLKARAMIGKRFMKRKESETQDPDEKKRWKRCHEDLVDKESILEDACKATEIQYRAANRALTVYMDAAHERYMPDSITKSKGYKEGHR